MLVYSYPVYSPQVVYSTPYVQSQHQQLRDFVEAAEAAATRQYLSQLEEQRARVELHRQVAIRQAEYQRREALAAQYAQSRRGLRTGYAPRRRVPVKQEGAPLVFVPTFEQERRVEDYLGTALAELLGLREDAEAGRIRAEQARIEQAEKDDAVRAARKAEALKEAFKAAAFEELRKANEREEARRAAALEQARQLRAKQEAERVYAIHNALKAAAFAEAHQASLVIPERKAEPTEEAAHILSVHRALEVAALEQARKAQGAKVEEDRKTQIEAAAKLEESRKAAEIKRRAAIKAKKIVDSDRMRKAAIENSRARFVAEIEALRKELESASNAAAGETPKPNSGTIPVEHEIPAPEANESTESNVERLSRNRAARAIQRRWRSRSADRTAHKDALDTISTLRSRFEFLKSTFVAPEYLEFRDPTSISTSTSTDSDSDLPTLSFAPANAGVHSYTHELTKLMMLADGVSSAGSDSIRNARKDFVKMVEKELDEVDGIVKAVWEKMHPQGHEELVRVPIVEKNEIVEGEKPTEAKEEAAEEVKIEAAEPLNVKVKESESVVDVEPAVPVAETRAEDVAVVVESEPTPVSITVAEVDTELTTQPSGDPVTSESAEEVKVEAAEPLNVKVKESESVVDAEPAVPVAEPRAGGVTVVESEPSPVLTTVAEVDTELSNQPSEGPVASESQQSVKAEPNVDPSASIAIEVEESQEGSVDVPVTLVLTEEQEEKPTSTPIVESSDTATISSEIEAEVSKDVEEEQAEVLEEPHVEKSLHQAAVLPSTEEPVIVEAAEEPTLSTIELEDLPSVPTEEPTSIASSTPINLDIDVPTPSSVSTASESDAEVDESARSGSPAIDSFDMVYPDSPSSRPLQQPEAEVQVTARLEQTKANDDSSSVSSDTPSLEGFEML